MRVSRAGGSVTRRRLTNRESLLRDVTLSEGARAVRDGVAVYAPERRVVAQGRHVPLESLLPGITGAGIGVLGSLAVGIYIQRRLLRRQARNAARAVYFELDGNRSAIEVARSFGSFTPLSRASYERLLPELAALLDAASLQTLARAYVGHAGYQQILSDDSRLPPAARKQGLTALLAAQQSALDVLRRRAFSPSDLVALDTTAGLPGPSIPGADQPL
jgi:hypothetical protein